MSKRAMALVGAICWCYISWWLPALGQKPVLVHPQGHRWELLRFHLNGLCTQQRLVSARRLPLAGPCHLCGGSVDSTTHLLQCPITRQAESRLRTAARMPEGQLTVSEMFFQHARDGAEKAFGVALFAAVWFVRDRAWRRIGYVPPDVLTDSVVSAIQCHG